MTTSRLAGAQVPASTTILAFFVPGTPKPKGSLKHIGRGRLIEQVAGSADWKRKVADVARLRNRGRAPHLGPVEIEATVYVERPASAPKSRVLPITRSSGDSDKHARNLLDALAAPTKRFSGAGVYRDDAQVTDLTIRKRHADAEHRPGIAVVVRAIGDVSEVAA